jgi:salicylate hydroxylase
MMPQRFSKDSRVAIIGGGIGGLTLAKELQMKDFGRVTVFEAWTELKTRGGSITVTSASRGGAQDVLDALHLGEKVEAVGTPVSTVKAFKNGRMVLQRDIFRGTRIMREALQRVLFESLAPGTVRLGMPLRGFTERGDRVELQFDNDVTEEFDLVVAADGINSMIGATLFPDSGKQFTGTVVYQVLAHGEFVPEGMFYQHHIDCGDHGFNVRAFPGSGFDGRWDMVGFIMRSETPASSDWGAEGTQQHIQPLLDAMDEHGGGCPGWMRDLVQKAERVNKWGIYEHGIKPSWISAGGKIVLLGDAAHAMAPFLGLGAQTAMLDAQALAAELARAEPLADALLAYEARRKRPSEYIMNKAKREGLGITSSGLAACYRTRTMNLVVAVQTALETSTRWYVRLAGAALLKVHELGFLASEQLNTWFHHTPSLKA